ncbi:hypothetical protein BHM03_00020805 [Ensete ventricosum]|nr:hypothetical protein BHM03_00020805 [Ensete ventricosum]
MWARDCQTSRMPEWRLSYYRKSIDARNCLLDYVFRCMVAPRLLLLYYWEQENISVPVGIGTRLPYPVMIMWLHCEAHKGDGFKTDQRSLMDIAFAYRFKTRSCSRSKEKKICLAFPCMPLLTSECFIISSDVILQQRTEEDGRNRSSSAVS